VVCITITAAIVVLPSSQAFLTKMNSVINNFMAQIMGHKILENESGGLTVYMKLEKCELRTMRIRNSKFEVSKKRAKLFARISFPVITAHLRVFDRRRLFTAHYPQ
jgi:hypothetical protein